jgi:hypothetical protein
MNYERGLLHNYGKKLHDSHVKGMEPDLVKILYLSLL